MADHSAQTASATSTATVTLRTVLTWTQRSRLLPANTRSCTGPPECSGICYHAEWVASKRRHPTCCNGHTLISDASNNRIVEVSKAKKVVWTYVTNTRPGSDPNPLPTRAVRLANGLTVISDQFNHQVISVNLKSQVVWSYGQIAVAGNGPDQLNGPYDAKVIGDYTGLTSPFWPWRFNLFWR
jgi:hypothetical protein